MNENLNKLGRGYTHYEGEIGESGGFITPLQKENRRLEYIIPFKLIRKDTKFNMSTFENNLYEDIQAEIARLEEELNFLRQFIKLVGSSPKEPTKSISKPSIKSPRAKSAQKKTEPKLTKSGKKIGRPTNAEKEARLMLAKAIASRPDAIKGFIE